MWVSDAGLSARFFELVRAYSDAEPVSNSANADHTITRSCDMLQAVEGTDDYLHGPWEDLYRHHRLQRLL